MRSLAIAGLLLLHLLVHAQIDQYNILNRDSFSPSVKKVTLTCFLPASDPGLLSPQTSRYMECDSTGKWIVRIDTYSDGDESKDTVKYDPKTRTRVVVTSNDFEPSKAITVFNKDGTVKSFLAQPEQRDPQLTEYEYDDAKRVTKKTLTFVESKTEERFLYDEKGRLITYKRFSGSVTAKKLQLDYEEKYDYDGSNSSVMYGFYYGANEQVRVRDTVVSTYDDAHRIISKTEMMENGSWKRLSFYEYDAHGRLIHEHVNVINAKGEESGSDKNLEYDSMGYYRLYLEDVHSYAITNQWTTTYNEYGLPVQCYYQTAAETYYYEWRYEYR
jgi:hypothetical protein